MKTEIADPPSTARNIRLALLAPGEVFGGAERQILTLLECIRNAVADLSLLLFHDTELASRARKSGFQVEILGARALWDRQSLEHLIRTLSDRKVDVVHIHGYRAAVYAALARRHHFFTAVKTEHGAVESQTAGLPTNFRPRFYRLIENVASRKLKARIVYVTRELQHRCAAEHHGLDGRVIYNGIGPVPPVMLRPPSEYGSGKVNLVVIGRLEPVKGIETAIRALTCDPVPDDVMLHIIGAGPLHSSLARLILDIGLGQRAHLLGFRSNVYDYLAHADALLIPSLHEGLPYTLLEAMKLGIPVIASSVGGLAEVLSNRESALLIPPQSPQQLAQSIRELLDDTTLATTLREKGRTLAASQFSAQNMGKAYLDLFKEAVVHSGRV